MYFNKKQSSQSLLLQYFNSWIIIYLCFSSWMVWYMWCSVCLWNWHLLLCAHIWNPKVVIYPFHKCFLCWNLRKALSLNMDFIDSVSRAFDDIYGSACPHSHPCISRYAPPHYVPHVFCGSKERERLSSLYGVRTY